MRDNSWYQHSDRKNLTTVWLFSELSKHKVSQYLRGVIAFLALINGLLLLILYHGQLISFMHEIKLIYRNDHVQSCALGDLTITTYGPEMLVKGQSGQATVVCSNNSTGRVSDVHITLFSPGGELRFTADESKASNALQVERLNPGETAERAFEFLSVTPDCANPIKVGIEANYHTGGLNGAISQVSTDVQLLSLAPPGMTEGFSKSIEINVGQQSTPDLHLRVVYTSQPDSRSGRSNTEVGELQITAESERSLIHDLNLTVYTDASEAYIDPGPDGTNLMHFEDLKLHEKSQQILPITLMHFSEPLNLMVAVDYTVAQEPERIVQKYVPDAFSYASSDFSQLHSNLGGVFRVLERLASFLDQTSSTVTRLIGALAALLGALALLIRPFKYLREWVHGSDQKQEEEEEEEEEPGTEST